MAITRGVDLMRQLNEGSLEQAPSECLQKTREEVTSAIEELLDVGARIRPLLVEGKRVGWVRGIHLSERKALKRWLYDEMELVEQLLLLGTTLSIEEIRSLSMVEMRSLSRVIREMTDSDLSLYPFISAFVTTNVSEQLWFSRGTEATAFRERTVSMPDGKQVRIMAASDQSRLWETLCNTKWWSGQKSFVRKLFRIFFFDIPGSASAMGINQ